jgi:hypothetical protein
MATLSELIRGRRRTGQGVGQSLGGSLKDKLKEKMDPRRIFSQTGILTALFPMLRSFKAGSSRAVGSSLHNKSVELLTSTTSLSVDQLGVIEKNTEITAKNSMVLPGLARDMNVLRQNIAKLLKSFGVKPTNKADAFFRKSREREMMYESQIKKIEPLKVEEKEKTSDDKSIFEKILDFISTLTTKISIDIGVLFTSLKNTMSVILSPISEILKTAILGFITIISPLITTLLSSLARIFTFSSLSTVLGFVVKRLPVIMAIMTFMDAYEKSQQAKVNRQAIVSSKSKISSANYTPEDVSQLQQELDKAVGAGGLNFTENVKFRQDLQLTVMPPPIKVKKILEDLTAGDNGDERRKLRGEDNLIKLGVSRPVLQKYYDETVLSIKENKPRIPLNVIAEQMGERQNLSSLFPLDMDGGVTSGLEESLQPVQPTQGQNITNQTIINKQEMINSNDIDDSDTVIPITNNDTSNVQNDSSVPIPDVFNIDIMRYFSGRAIV